MLAGRPPRNWPSQDPTGRTRRKDGRMLSWLGELRLQPVSETDIDILHINIAATATLLHIYTQFYTNTVITHSAASAGGGGGGYAVSGGGVVGDSMRRCSSNVAPHTYSVTHFRVLEWSCPALVALTLKLGRHRPTGTVH